MSLEHANHRLAGRVLVAGFPGPEAPASLLDSAAAGALAGVALFRRNLPSAAAAHALTQKLLSRFPRPPLVAIDQEGGRVRRLDAPVLPLPPMRHFGQLDRPDLTRTAGKLVGRQLRALGINWNLAPVLDIHSRESNPVIGDRAFSSVAATVTRHAGAFAAGLTDSGILNCGKHFPGHGDTELDSHTARPVVDQPVTTLLERELVPFRDLAQQLDSIMTAHVMYPALDAARPATLSPTILREWLQREIGFRGLVVSDDLEMAGIAAHIGPGEAAVDAIVAGCDALLVCSDLERLFAVRAVLAEEASRSPAFHARLLDASEKVANAAAASPCRAVPNGVEEVERLYAGPGKDLLAALAMAD